MIIAVLARVFLMRNDKPVHSIVRDKKGYVMSKSGRRPYVSMVKNAGKANTQLRMPVPIEINRAVVRP